MPRLIPIDGSLAHSTLDVSLEGTTYRLSCRWNHRAEAYFLSISDAEGTLLLANRKVVLTPSDTAKGVFTLTGRFRDSRLPLGDFIAVDTTSEDVEPRFGELGTGARVQLVYLSSDELLGEGEA